MSAPSIIDPRSECILHHDIESLSLDFDQGKQVGESWGIKELDAIYTKMPGFLTCHTGWPNSGKSKITNFKNLVRAVKYGDRCAVWTPEEITTRKINGKIVRSANNVFDDLVHMYTGKVPYGHWKEKYGRRQMEYAEYIEAHEFISKHFIVIDPKDKHYKSIIDQFRYVYEEYGTSNISVDPTKNIILDETGRGDRDLDYCLYAFKEFILDTQQTADLIVHPKTDKIPKNSDGSYKRCDQFSLNGGAAWNNNADCIMSWYRPFAHKIFEDPNYSMLIAINYKQRDEQLTNRKGEYDKIEFDFFKNRYYFNGVCPIDGELKKGFQPEIKFTETWQQAKTDEVPF